VNANDVDWLPSRFAKPDSVPGDAVGFKEMTFVLVQRELAELTMEISRREPDDFVEKERLIRQVELALYDRYIKLVDRSNPSQTIVAALVEIKLSSLRLTLSHRQSRAAKAESRVKARYQYVLLSPFVLRGRK